MGAIRDMIGDMTEAPIARGPEIIIEKPDVDIEEGVKKRLQAELASCPDIAFAHLPQVTVVGHQEEPQLSLFVWLVPEAVGSLRAALNLVSEAVARALPEDVFLDVLILNSVPDLLLSIEEAGCLIVERDSEERRRACEAASLPPEEEPENPRHRFWPF